MKIGLLALSGLRAHDPELLRLGLTLPGVIQRGNVIARLPSLGLLYIAAVTPPRHELRYFEASGDGAEPAEVYECDLVAISTFSAQVFEAYAIADRLRAAGVRVAMGGLHVTVRPDEALEHADYVVTGEAEVVWPHVVRAIEAGTEQRLWHAADFSTVDVQDLPLPRYDLLAERPYNRFTVQTSRGCPWRCDFCASNVMLRQKYRKRPVEHVRQAGCRQVLIGLESPEPSSLEGVELRSNFKARRWATNREAVREIQSHGITVNGCFILGLDGHTTDIFEQVLTYAQETPLYDVQITVLTAFPGTPLYDRLLAEGRIIHPGRWDLCTLFDVNFVPKLMTADQLRKGIYWLAERLYSDESMESRQRGFYNSQPQYRSERPAAAG